jgi:hypothetical protein
MTSTTTTITTTQSILHTFLVALTEMIFSFLSYLDDVEVKNISSMYN